MARKRGVRVMQRMTRRAGMRVMTAMLLGSAGMPSCVSARRETPSATDIVPPSVVDLDVSGQGAPVFRIPALAVTKTGTLLAAYDARPGMADVPSHIQVVLRRSVDGGATWGNRVVVRADTAPFGFGDPSLLVDRTTGRVFLFHAASVRQGFAGARPGNSDNDPEVLHADLSWSDDDGASWMTPSSYISDQGPHMGRSVCHLGSGDSVAARRTRGPSGATIRDSTRRSQLRRQSCQ